MYYRRKVLLSLIEVFGGEIEALRLQKLLFLLENEKSFTNYDFVPYHYGCFSFQAQQDLNTLKKYGIVSESESKWKLNNGSYLLQLNNQDRNTLLNLETKFKKYTSSELIKYTYKSFPYYAIKSKIASKYLNSIEIESLANIISNPIEKALFTIGYEGISLEAYLKKLVNSDVKVLVDVRKNALSMKYGFSKGQLKKAIEGLGMQYVHISELGIDSNKRQNLSSQNEYDNLFVEYAKSLPQRIFAVEQLLSILHTNQRVAITCFEKSHCQCHRGTLALELSKSEGWDFPLIHL